MSNQVTVYSTDTCPHCIMMKKLLAASDVPYTKVNVQRDQAPCADKRPNGCLDLIQTVPRN
ncbi:glutaredoxin family protein [Planococcus kocurii]|uniref:glutaredoxin family protein n=1 Tax=Planococcus kocurii TaxID=1374 RepID=UPI000AF64062|nr:glutaredoxin family protein [Planococcus kocurii]